MKRHFSELKLGQQAALCHLLHDGRWRLADHLAKRFGRCVWTDGVSAAIDFPRQVFLATLGWLVNRGACESRVRKGKEWVRLGKPSKQLGQRMARTAAFEEAAMGLARLKLRASERPSVEQTWDELMDLKRPQPDPRGRVLVADEVIAWYAREASRPDVASDDFWLRAGFFTERALWYLRDLPDGVTRLIAKALLFEVLSGEAGMPSGEVLADDWEAAGWANHAVHNGMSRRMMVSLNDALWGFVCPRDEWPVARPKLVKAVAEADWPAIGSRLSEELKRHAHRRGLRALEVACAMPYEHAEARLGGFVGTPEETFLEVTYGHQP